MSPGETGLITGHDDDVAFGLVIEFFRGKRGEPDRNCISGTSLLMLRHEFKGQTSGRLIEQRVPNPLGAMANNDNGSLEME